MQAAKLIIKTVRSDKNVLRINSSKILMARYQKKRNMKSKFFWSLVKKKLPTFPAGWWTRPLKQDLPVCNL
jgi:hypothetical protein